jgi:hypothetical protein
MPIFFQDIYGTGAPVGDAPQPSGTGQGSGSPDFGNKPMYYWLAFVALLVGVRILYHAGKPG